MQNQLVSRSNQDLKKFKSEIKKAERRLEQLDKIISKLYEDRALEKISEERYISMNSKYEAEYIKLSEEAKHIKTELETADESLVNAYQFVDMVEKYIDIQELNARILNELIEKIVVHEKEIINGEKYCNINLKNTSMKTIIDIVIIEVLIIMIDAKIFISHCANDSEIGEKFLNFLLSLGYKKENIFYSSKYHNGVEIGKNFPNVVRDNFIGANIVVLLLNENFYNSYYCVCEEGAAWISVNKEIVPILLGNLNFGDMKGFIDSSTKSFSPKYSETEELYTYFAKRSCVDFDEKEAKEKYTEFVETSSLTSIIKTNKLGDKDRQILKGLQDSNNGMLPYISALNVVTITIDGKNICEGLDLADRLEYKDSVEKLVELGYIKKSGMFISLTGKGARISL